MLGAARPVIELEPIAMSVLIARSNALPAVKLILVPAEYVVLLSGGVPQEGTPPLIPRNCPALPTPNFARAEVLLAYNISPVVYPLYPVPPSFASRVPAGLSPKFTRSCRGFVPVNSSPPPISILIFTVDISFTVESVVVIPSPPEISRVEPSLISKFVPESPLIVHLVIPVVPLPALPVNIFLPPELGLSPFFKNLRSVPSV